MEDELTSIRIVDGWEKKDRIVLSDMQMMNAMHLGMRDFLCAIEEAFVFGI